ncbi:MAG: cytochrome c biogenesis protein CcsA [Chloroflexi bacterium]|nr:cytochrome c biogenesis protein CcsA [Chloroflexota bacterium]MDA0243220.1 cytochrome c biogenesis protein CcsA [Chloroflexota bacterium]
MNLPFLTQHTRRWNWIAAVSIAITLGMIFWYAPTERMMGHVQRIFYFHVGSAWVASITLFVALVCGALYLRRPHPTWDALSLASVEIGVVLFSMTIVSGSIWGRPAWNTWWEWSPRLTSATIMWLVYVAYLMLRAAVDDEDKKRRFAAVYVIAAFVTTLITYGSIRILRDIHPVMFGGTLETAQGQEQGLQDFQGLAAAEMGITLTVACIAFMLLYVAWVANRLRLQQMENEVAQLKASLR